MVSPAVLLWDVCHKSMQKNSFNPTLDGIGWVLDYHTVHMLTKFLTGNFLLFNRHPKMYNYQLFSFHHKDLASSMITGPVMGFLSHHIGVNHWYNLSNCGSIRFSGVSASRLNEFTLYQINTNNSHSWVTISTLWQNSFIISQVSNLWNYKRIITEVH